MKIQSAEFIKSCVTSEQYPKGTFPEVALVGRSNVGKSSALNSLLNRKGLAKVGKIPGKTQLLNFFRVSLSDPQIDQFVLVDLPGYGYAKVPQSIRKQWGPMVNAYLTSREMLCGIIVFVDIRRCERSDVELIEWLTALGHSMIVVATKVDKIPPSQHQASLNKIRKGLSLLPHIRLLPYSSFTRVGRLEVMHALKNLIMENT